MSLTNTNVFSHLPKVLSTDHAAGHCVLLKLIVVVNTVNYCCLWVTAQLTSWSLILYGTATPPRYLVEYLAAKFTTVVHTAETTLPVNTSNNDTAQHNFVTSTNKLTTDSSAETVTSTDIGKCLGCRY